MTRRTILLFLTSLALPLACSSTTAREPTTAAEREPQDRFEAPSIEVDATPTTRPEAIERFPDGKLKAVRQYKLRGDGLYVLDGAYTAYYPSGKKEIEGRFTNGQPDGIFSTYYPNGIKATQRTFVRGVEQGQYVVWDEQGYKIWEVEYVDGKPHGRYASFHRNGGKRGQGTCVRGKQHGQHRVWDEQGKLIRITRYDHGVKLP
jgi:antitoxin component YwqK of YwqJK toxin-antitoxin module